MPNVLNEFAGDGVTRTFNFSMTGGYLSRDYVYFFTRPNDDLLNYTPYNDDAVTWITDFSVQTANHIPVGTTFVILRSTTLEPLVDFQNTSRITEKNLDTATWQSIHIAAETSDTVGRIQIVSSEASDLSRRAIQEATDASDDAEAARVAAQAAQVSAGLSSDAAGVAETKAEQAALAAQTAVNTAAAADGKADAATLTANAADQKADSALITANAANAKASTAIETSNGAVTTANAADSKANTAVATSNSATSTADAATTTAVEAKTIAQEARDLIDSAVSGAVVSFNGRAGIVTPGVGDYTKAMVGLGNVDNVSSADLRDRTTHTGTQPISTVAGLQLALDSKADNSAVVQAIAMAATFTTVPITFQAWVIIVTNPHFRTFVWHSAQGKYVRAPWHRPGIIFSSDGDPVNITHGIQMRSDVVYNTADYPDLAAFYGVIGPTFVLKDARARVIRGADNGKGIDTALVNGYLQADAIQRIQGSLVGVNSATFASSGSGALKPASTLKRINPWPQTEEALAYGLGLEFDSSLSARSAPETRVKSLVATHYITI